MLCTRPSFNEGGGDSVASTPYVKFCRLQEILACVPGGEVTPGFVLDPLQRNSTRQVAGRCSLRGLSRDPHWGQIEGMQLEVILDSTQKSFLEGYCEPNRRLHNGPFVGRRAGGGEGSCNHTGHLWQAGGGSLKASLQIKNQLESLHTSGDQAMHFNAQAHS